MTKIEQLVKWLGNRQRLFVNGFTIFMGLAKPFQIEKYGPYLREVTAEVDPFDPHFTLLVNLLSRIEREHRIDDTAYPSAHEEVNPLKAATSEDSAGTPRRVTREELPLKLQRAYDRIRETVPLIASLHAELSVKGTSKKHRKSLAARICALDDERKDLWKLIDGWSDGSLVIADETAGTDADGADSTARGLQIARRIKRLKENIRSSKRSAEKAKEDGRQVVYENAMSRIEAYQQELDELNKEINKETE